MPLVLRVASIRCVGVAKRRGGASVTSTAHLFACTVHCYKKHAMFLSSFPFLILNLMLSLYILKEYTIIISHYSVLRCPFVSSYLKLFLGTLKGIFKHVYLTDLLGWGPDITDFPSGTPSLVWMSYNLNSDDNIQNNSPLCLMFPKNCDVAYTTLFSSIKM